MSKTNQRAALIDAAERLFQQQGYRVTGARDIAVAAGVPQGSFTNHFRSKETLGIAALDQYVERIGERMRVTLDDRSRSPSDRLLSYFEMSEAMLAEGEWQSGCLIPDLANELSSYREPLRGRLIEALRAHSARFEVVLREMVPDVEVEAFADFIMAAWHGALIRSKAEQSGEPIRRFLQVLRLMLRPADQSIDRR